MPSRPEHAGVGSALNDTIQQAGAALGVAVLGSIFASAFTAEMPDTAPEAARRSIAEALAIGDAGLATAAREAFTAAMSTTFVVGTSSVVGAAVLAFFLIRKGRPAEVAEETVELAA